MANSNEKFRVKYGLQVGDNTNADAMTVDGLTGDIATDGDIDVKGGNITNSTGALAIATTSGGDLSLSPASPGQVNINSALDVNGNINGDYLSIDDIRIDGSAISTSGAVNLVLHTNGGTNSGQIQITQGASANILITPNGSGDVYLESDTVYVGDNNANATVSTYGTGDLTLNTNGGTNSGFITIADGANGDITIDPHGTGKVIIAGDLQVDGTTTTINSTTLDVDDINITLAKGAANAAAANGGGITLEGPTTAATLTYASSDDSWNFNKKTAAPELQVDNININGNTIISTDTNGNINLTPNGSGDLVLTLANGGNLTNTRNYVYGGIRNATTESIGDIWALNSTGPSTPVRGISIDNSVDTTKTAGLALRQGSNTGTASSRLIFERSRGTVGTPSALQSGDILGIINATGYTSTGWVQDNISPVAPMVLSFSAAENWVSNTNLGTQFNVVAAPTNKLIAATADLVTTIAHNPQTATYRSDAFTFRQGKTGTTNLMTLDSSGNMVVTGDVRINGSDIQSSDGNTNITLTSNTLTAFAGDIKVGGNDIQDSAGQNVIRFRQESADYTYMYAERVKYFDTNTSSQSNINFIAGDSQGATIGDRSTQFSLFHARTTAGEYPNSSYYTWPYNHGTGNYSAIGSGEILGALGFGGTYSTTSSPDNLGSSVELRGISAEAFTATNNGGRFTVAARKIGGNTFYDALTIDSTNANISSDTITLENNSGTDYLVLNSTKAQFSKPVQLPSYTAAALTAITGAVGWMAAVSDSAGGSNPNGMIAFWDTTNARWSYIHDNSAV